MDQEEELDLGPFEKDETCVLYVKSYYEMVAEFLKKHPNVRNAYLYSEFPHVNRNTIRSAKKKFMDLYHFAYRRKEIALAMNALTKKTKLVTKLSQKEETAIELVMDWIKKFEKEELRE
ncbi:MAG: hypothetical protein OEL89_04420 [Candidatus Peregrinibacteria bacterium]|nr:hypothetical protein [Candidatus Peregrinibacteria bacterium]